MKRGNYMSGEVEMAVKTTAIWRGARSKSELSHMHSWLNG